MKKFTVKTPSAELETFTDRDEATRYAEGMQRNVTTRVWVEHKGYEILSTAERTALQYRFPSLTEEALDDACAWSGPELQEEITDEGYGLHADRGVEIEVGHDCVHAFFYGGRLQGCVSV